MIGLTADHGMNAKHDPQTGEPNVIYLQDVMDEWLGATQGAGDPADHGSVCGSPRRAGFVCDDLFAAAMSSVAQVIERIGGMHGVEVVLDNRAACERFELPNDRVGDIVVISKRDVVLGTRREEHDLSGLTVPLRSHGGLSGAGSAVDFQPASRRSAPSGKRLRNFDVFDLALNHVATS